MSFRRTVQSSTNALFHLQGGKRPIRFGDATFAMYQLWLNGIEPRVLDGQWTDEDACTLTSCLHLAIVRLGLGSYCPVYVPMGIIPDQGQDPFAPRMQFSAAPVEELGGDGIQRTILGKAQL